jgi:hypothetical protein
MLYRSTSCRFVIPKRRSSSKWLTLCSHSRSTNRHRCAAGEGEGGADLHVGEAVAGQLGDLLLLRSASQRSVTRLLGPGPRRCIPTSSTTTRSPSACTSQPGSSRSSSPTRSAQRSGLFARASEDMQAEGRCPGTDAPSPSKLAAEGRFPPVAGARTRAEQRS